MDLYPLILLKSHFVFTRTQIQLLLGKSDRFFPAGWITGCLQLSIPVDVCAVGAGAAVGNIHDLRAMDHGGIQSALFLQLRAGDLGFHHRDGVLYPTDPGFRFFNCRRFGNFRSIKKATEARRNRVRERTAYKHSCSRRKPHIGLTH